MRYKNSHSAMTLATVRERELHKAAERICSGAFGGEIKLGPPQTIRDWDGRSWTRRFEVVDAPSGVPRSVVAKHFLLGKGHSFDEWAGLAFVNKFADGLSPVPTLYGGDVDLDLIIIEDLGDARQYGLGTILRGDDPKRATTMLGELMSAVGRIHATGFGNEQEYRQLRRSLPPRLRDDFHMVHQFEEMLHQFGLNARSAGYQVSRWAESELQSVVTELRNPTQFLGFSHGDVCPSNAIQQGQRVRLFDLEVCGYRQVLLDGVYPQVRYLNCQEAGRIPTKTQRHIADVYRSELAKRYPLANEDSAFGRALVVAGAAWLASLVVRIPSALAKDRKRMMGTDRQRILHALREFGFLAADHGQLPALGDAALELRNNLRARWPGDHHHLAYFPAFQ
ncbi:hypothetical protein KFU94_01420 [Chloroflexi bacterium TSY]|nr:hypothetical protein [Chloroflexi bacterium TSY]